MGYIVVVALAALTVWFVLGDGYEKLKGIPKDTFSAKRQDIAKMEPANTKSCTKCGAKMSLEYRYCTVCGTTLPDMPGSYASNSINSQTDKAHKLSIAVKVLLLAGLICFFALLFVFHVQDIVLRK